MTRATFWATAEEMAQLTAEIEGLAARFDGRAENPALRPEGARSAHLWAVAHGDVDVTSSDVDAAPSARDDA